MIATVRSDWAVEKEILDQSLDAFKRELKSLEGQLDQVDSGGEQIRKELVEIEAEKVAFRLASDELKASVAKLEARILGMASGFPTPVTERIEPLFSRIPEDPAQTKLGLSARLQNVVGILNELDKFNGAITVVSELRKDESGAEVQVRVLYLGLAQAYFVDQTGRFCGYGIASSSGWSWTIAPDLGSAISRAIGVYENSQPATFVSLPVSVQ